MASASSISTVPGGTVLVSSPAPRLTHNMRLSTLQHLESGRLVHVSQVGSPTATAVSRIGCPAARPATVCAAPVVPTILIQKSHAVPHPVGPNCSVHDMHLSCRHIHQVQAYAEPVRRVLLAPAVTVPPGAAPYSPEAGVAVRRYAPPLSSASQISYVSSTVPLPQSLPVQAAPSAIDRDARLAEFLDLHPNCSVDDANNFLEAAGWQIPSFIRPGHRDARGTVLQRDEGLEEALRRSLEEGQPNGDWDEAVRRSLEEDSKGFAVPPMELDDVRRCTRTIVFRQGGCPDQSCAVCLTNFEDGETLRVLPCAHCFHDTCADQWLLRSAQCPTCRGPVAKRACALHITATTRLSRAQQLMHRPVFF